MDALGIASLGMAVLGHLALARGLINTLYRRYVRWWIKPPRAALVGAFTVGGLIWMIQAVGLTGPRLLHGGSWDDVPAAWRVYMLLCAAAVPVGIILLTVRLLRPPPRGLLAVESRVVDARAELAGAELSAGFRGVLARLPGNQVFQLELPRKQIALARLPHEWDGLRILHISDLHLNGTPTRDFFRWAIEQGMRQAPDLAVLTGDVLDNVELRPWLADILGPLNPPLGRFFVLGNHDADRDPEAIGAAVGALGWTNLTSRYADIAHRGRRLLLAGTSMPWIKPHPDLSLAPPTDLRILLSHSPTWHTWAAEQGYDLMLAGHLHGGQIRLPLLGALHGARYDCGVFQAGSTLLHITRGLGQLMPIRLNCLPELALLVLRASP